MAFRCDTYCGLYCGGCAILLANREGTVEEIARAEGVQPEELRCHGCKTEVVATFCTDCYMKECAERRGIEFCIECDEYPCERLVAFKEDKYPHHSVVLKNLERMREIGLQPWLSEQKSRWSCPNCGQAHSWYDESCKECGAELYSCRDEEKEFDEESSAQAE